MIANGYAIAPLAPVLTIDEVAEVLRCKVGTVNGYVKSKQLDPITIGLERRFRATDVIAFIEERRANRWGPRSAPRRKRRKCCPP